MSPTRSEIEKMLADRLEFLIGVGHDMRAPLTGIAGFAAVLAELESVAADPTASEAVAYIRKEAQRLVELLNQLLDFGHVEQGGPEPRSRADRPGADGPPGSRAVGGSLSPCHLPVGRARRCRGRRGLSQAPSGAGQFARQCRSPQPRAEAPSRWKSVATMPRRSCRSPTKGPVSRSKTANGFSKDSSALRPNRIQRKRRSAAPASASTSSRAWFEAHGGSV